MGEQAGREVLHHLIETCHDAERGFAAAAEQAATPEMRSLFRDMARDHHRYAEHLLPYAQRLGGIDRHDGTAAGTLHRGWMTVRGWLAHDHDGVLLAEAGRGERFALSVYDKAVEGALPPAARELVEAQDAAVRHAYLRLHRWRRPGARAVRGDGDGKDQEG